MVERRVAGTRTSAADDDVSLRPTAAGSTRTDTVVLLRLDSGALERKVYTGCVQAHAASASSRAMVSHGRTCAVMRGTIDVSYVVHHVQDRQL